MNNWIKKKARLRVSLCVMLLVLCFTQSRAQNLYGTTGLLHMPTAEMQQDRTFIFGGNYLQPQATPYRWDYFTYNYYVDVTWLPWLELGYTCTLFRGTALGLDNHHFTNQDRHFNVRLRAWKEGWWKSWTPQVVIGANDPGTTSGAGEIIRTNDVDKGNGFFCRYYVALTKHVDIQHVGRLGAHASLVYGRDEPKEYVRPNLGADLRLALPGEGLGVKLLNGMDVMAEYNTKNLNVGCVYRVWNDHIGIVAEMLRCRYFNGGVQFMVRL